MRPEELVRRAEQHVRAGGRDVDRAVRRVMDGVDPGERPRLVRERGDPGHVLHGPDPVRGPRERDHARPVGEPAAKVVQVERRVVVDVDELDAHADVVAELEPRRHVRVVVELRHEDLVAGPQLARQRPREGEVQRRHVGAEGHLLLVAAQEVGGREPGVRDERVGGAARREGAAGVRVRLPEVRRDRVDDLVRDLRPAGAVEERERPVERGVARADGLDVERGRGHR